MYLWHSGRVRLRHRNQGPENEFWGCDYCAEPDNRLYGHLDQICNDIGGVVLLRCPLCQSIYQPGARGEDEFRSLSPDEAAAVLPLGVWRVVPGDA
jgi:hypothetical protein